MNAGLIFIIVTIIIGIPFVILSWVADVLDGKR